VDVVLKASWERRVFAPLYKASPAGAPVLDKHREFASGSTLYEGITRYLNESDRKLRLQHSDRVIGVVEQAVAWPYEVRLPLHDHRGIQKATDTFPAGSVFAWVRFEPWAWENLVLTGRLNGLSVGGSAKRIYANAESTETTKAARGSLVRQAAAHGSVRLT
jgi:hypothetical protein